MDGRQFRGGGTGGLGLTGPVPQDLWILLGVVLGTFSLRFFDGTAWLPSVLELTPSVWRQGWLWQLVTYPFVGGGVPGIWFLVSLLILFLFGRDVLSQLGRRRFWRLLLYAAGAASLVAMAVALLGIGLTGAPPGAQPFVLMQGQNMLLTVLIAAFATLNRRATIYLFFVLPIQASWFLGLEILFAFLGFLGTLDLAGFLGVCAAVGFTYGHLTSWRRIGGLSRLQLRAEQLWIKLRLGWMKRKRGMRVVKDDSNGKRGPWVH